MQPGLKAISKLGPERLGYPAGSVPVGLDQTYGLVDMDNGFGIKDTSVKKKSFVLFLPLSNINKRKILCSTAKRRR
jgi:hypothetical protein